MFTLMVIFFIGLSLIVATVLIARLLGIGYNPHPFQNLPIPAARTGNAEITKWRSVKIKPGLISCKRADRMTGEIYFAADAPTFPLDSCTEKLCQCKYVYLDDRRDGSDRRESTEYSADLFALHEKERRGGKDRRTIDF